MPKKSISNGVNEYYMRKVLALALNAEDPRPNPYVGSILVKNNKVIATGFHRRIGEKHAEVVALDKAGLKARGAVLYVNLEPCRHFGRTPPCTERIIKSGVAQIVVGMTDPNPLNNGKGINLLRKAGIKTRVGILGKESRKINAVFMKYITQKMPYICVKVGQSLDGKIAARSFNSRWITSPAARNFAHKLRSNFDAVMVGVNTIIKDDPRLSGTSKNIKIIVDTNLRTPINSRIFVDGKIIIVTAKKIMDNKAVKLVKKGAQIVSVNIKDAKVNLRAMMKKLVALEISKILVEGGGELIGSLFDEKLVDEVKFFIAPKIIGGRKAVSSVMGAGISCINEAAKLKDVKVRRFGEDLLVEGSVACSRA